MRLGRSTDRQSSRLSFAQHLKTRHVLPDDAVDAMEQRGIDLAEFHDDEHDNDRAIGLDGDPHGDL